MTKLGALTEMLPEMTGTGKKHILEYGLQMARSKAPVDDQDRQKILEVFPKELEGILAKLPEAATYQEKDGLLYQGELMLELLQYLWPEFSDLPLDTRRLCHLTRDASQRERVIENGLDKLMAQPTVQAQELKALLELVDAVPEYFQKGILCSGLLHYEKSLSRLTADAKALLTEHLVSTIGQACQKASDDALVYLEIATDVCRFFPGTADAVEQALGLGNNPVNYFAVQALLTLGRPVEPRVVEALAKDLTQAHQTFQMLSGLGKGQLFPQEYRTAEYLAKSDLVHWLTYPTELGQAPEEIEYVGTVRRFFRREIYYVFRYRSHSDTLDQELHGRWLLGWSSDKGGTFSEFEPFEDFAGDTEKQTLKNIRKRILG